MQTFDQDLFSLYESNKISYDEAMRNADSKNELRLRVKLESKRDKTVAARRLRRPDHAWKKRRRRRSTRAHP